MKILLSFLFFLPFNLFAQPLAERTNFFDSYPQLDCCNKIYLNQEAPYTGFLLTPFQLIYLDTLIEDWEVSTRERLDAVVTNCSLQVQKCTQDSYETTVELIKQNEFLTISLEETVEAHFDTQELLQKTDEKLNFYFYATIMLATVTAATTTYIFIK